MAGDNVIGRAVWEIGADANPLVQDLDAAEKKVADVGRTAEASADDIGTAYSKAGDKAKLAIEGLEQQLKDVQSEQQRLAKLGITSGPIVDSLKQAETEIKAAARSTAGAVDDIGEHATKTGG